MLEKKDKQDNFIVEKIKDNYAWVIAITTTIGLIFANIMKFVEYTANCKRFNYYGLDKNLYIIDNQNFIYDLFISITFMIATWALMHLYSKIFKVLKKDKKVEFNIELIINIIFIILITSYNSVIYSSNLSIVSFFVYFIIITVTQIIAVHLGLKMSEKENNNYKLIDLIKILIICTIFIIVIFISRSFYETELTQEYRIVNGKQVILYTTKDYYLTLDCEIKGDTLIIYKGSQTKINNDNIKSELNKFKKIKLKQQEETT